MRNVFLYNCPKLRAKLSLAQCQANRERPDLNQIDNWELETPCRPFACENCKDWQEWDKPVKIITGVTNADREEI